MTDIPKDEAGSSAWLQQLWRDKDALLSSWHRDGVLEAPGLGPLPRHSPGPRLYSLGVSLGANAGVLGGLALVLGGQGWWGLVLGGLVLLGARGGIQYFLGLTQVAKGTSYGKKE